MKFHKLFQSLLESFEIPMYSGINNISTPPATINVPAKGDIFDGPTKLLIKRKKKKKRNA